MPRPANGKYYLADGVTVVPSVTTITGRFKEAGGLLQWAYKQGVAGKELYEARDIAAEAGSLVHAMVEARLKGGEPEEELLKAGSQETASQARQGFENYLAWESQTGMKVLSLEEPMVDEGLRYGGTPDAATIEINGELALADWKTGGVYIDHLVQLAAYRHLWNANHPNAPINGGFHLVRFSRDSGDWADHYFGELDDAFQMFKLLRDAWDFDARLKKRVK